MIRVGLVAALLFCVFLSGCASHRASMYNVSGEKVFLGWNNQQKLPHDAYYVLIEGDKEGTTWKVNEIYDHPIKGRSNEFQEVLFVDKEFRYVQPYFEYAASTVVKYSEEGELFATNSGYHAKTKSKYIDRGSWECGYIMKDHDEQYNPCNSRITKTDVAKSIGKNLFAAALTLGVASGTHKVVDKDRLAGIITQTNLFDQIKKSNLYSEASGQ